MSVLKKTAKILFGITTFTTSAIIQAVFSLIAIALIFAVSYIIGYRYLLGSTFWGNDAFSYYSVVEWYSKYFPQLPFWFPLQGGGVSFAGYPWLAAYLVNAFDRLTSFDLVQSYRILGFLSIPLTGVGIFFFAWTRLTEVKPIWFRQLLGAVAALFYVVSPMAWVWLVKWGFYAEHISHIFVAPTILFFDLYLERLFAKKYDALFRIGLIGALLFWLLAFNTHFFAGYSIVFILGLLIFTKFIFQKEKKIQLIKRIIPPLIIFCLLFAGLFIFRYLPYSTYNVAVAEGGFIGYGPGDLQGTINNTLPPKVLLSLEDPKYVITDPRSLIKDFRFQLYVWLLIIPSLIFSYFRSKKIFVYSIFIVIGFFINSNVDIKILLGKIPFINIFSGMLQGRAFFIPMRVIIPIVAVYGAYVVWEVVWTALFHLLKRSKPLYYLFLPIKIGMVLLLTLTTLYYIVSRTYSLPHTEPYFLSAGAFPDGLDLRDIWHRHRDDDVKGTEEVNNFVAGNPEYYKYEWLANFVEMRDNCLEKEPNGSLKNYPPGHICTYYTQGLREGGTIFPPLDLVLTAKKECASHPPRDYSGVYEYCKAYYQTLAEQLSWQNWYLKPVSSNISGEIGGTQSAFSGLPQDREYRYDMSGFAGRQVMIAPLVNNNSQIQVYINTLSLIYNAWNYQSQVMYTVFPLYQKPGVLTELGKWFGTEFVYLAGSGLEPFSYWQQDHNWFSLNKNTGGAAWYEFKEPTGITTWDNRPRMLIISDDKKFFYDQTYKSFTQGALLYDQAIPVKGNKEVDSYSYDYLKQFDMIYMRGYDYKWKWNAYRLLDQYVKNGGKLIFDTGWQYYVPDYKIDNAPDFMPFQSLDWQKLDTSAKYKLNDPEIAHDIDISKFGSLQWENTAWAVSVPQNLRDWAKPVLSYDDKPLAVVGEYGKGRVAWIGFNLIPHAETKDSNEELQFFNRLVEYVNGGFHKANGYHLDKTRISPDRVEFSLKDTVDHPSSLYFREAYYPDWQAKLITASGGNQNIDILRAGPGFMLLNLPPVNQGDKIVLWISKPLPQILAELTSILTVLVLIIYLFYPKIVLFAKKILKHLILNIFKTKRIHEAVKKNIHGRLAKVSAEWSEKEEEDY